MILIYLILLSYLFFIIWLLDGYKYSLKLNNVDNKKTPFISIIVAVKNESKTLPRLLSCLSHQNYPSNKYEIIIINDKSIDGTLAILRDSNINNLKFIDIKETPNNWSPKKWAIFNGIEQSKGEIILQTDGDCYMGNDWIKLMVKPFEDISVGFVTSLTPFLSKNNNITKDLYLMDSIAQDVFNGYAIGKGLTFSCTARSMAYRKLNFIDIKGYQNISHILSGDDDLLLHKMVHYLDCKVKFIINKKAAVFSEPPNSLLDLFNQRLRFASKGLFYFQKEFISTELKILLPILYLVNLIVSISIIKFCSTGLALYFFPFLFKFISDYFMVYPIYQDIENKWPWISFFILSIFHPFYIITFGVLGPLLNYKWK